MKRGRRGVIIVLILSLLASTFMRSQATAWQTRQANGRPGANIAGAIGGMDSFTLALLLGGLRGPLVMYLWSTSESQKTDKNLEDFDTKIEWIRRLQPEFDTVIMFQIWNLAYNISVMMASPANKYITIMQALEFAREADLERPDDINILSAVEQVYANKLGGPAVQERGFYDHQYRLETMSDAARKIAYPEDAQFRRLYQTRHDDDDTIGVLSLDDSNHILPQLVEPRRSAPADFKGDWNNGAPLQYLARYQPFPYGISPVARAYNAAKLSQVALTSEGQKPLQLSAMVIDSQPALQLRAWGEAEGIRARVEEARAFNVPAASSDSSQGDDALNSIEPSAKPADAHAFDAAHYSYQMAARLAVDARKEYDRHLGQREYLNRYQTYASHLDDVEEDRLLAEADDAYLMARQRDGAERDQAMQSARAAYDKASLQAKRIILKYYAEEAAIRQIYPHGLSKETVVGMSDARLVKVYDAVADASDHLDPHSPMMHADDRPAYLREIKRCDARIGLIDSQKARSARAD